MTNCIVTDEVRVSGSGPLTIRTKPSIRGSCRESAGKWFVCVQAAVPPCRLWRTSAADAVGLLLRCARQRCFIMCCAATRVPCCGACCLRRRGRLFAAPRDRLRLTSAESAPPLSSPPLSYLPIPLSAFPLLPPPPLSAASGGSRIERRCTAPCSYRCAPPAPHHPACWTRIGDPNTRLG